VALEQAEGLSAHVWVKAGEREVVGCEEAVGYAALAAFPSATNEASPDVAMGGGQGRFDPI
jgi:hypothetical protein